MATKIICDCCGKEIEQKESCNVLDIPYVPIFGELKVSVYRGLFIGWDDYELCAACEGKLKELIENKDAMSQKANNANVFELVNQLESSEKRICELSTENEMLKEQIEILKRKTIEELIERCNIKFEMSFDNV